MPDDSAQPDVAVAASPSTGAVVSLGWTPKWIALGILPLLLLAAIVVTIIATNGGIGDRNAPPIEDLSIQRISLPEAGMIDVDVINQGPDDITIAQVQVDGAYWSHSIDGDRTLGPLESARIEIPYPWVEDETHAIAIVSSNGIVFQGEIAVAVESPKSNAATFGRFALIGFYVGIVPIAIGMLWYPFMRRMGQRGLQFVLALTIGLLVFLVLDTFQEAGEVAASVPTPLDGPLLVPLVALLTFLLLITVSSSGRGAEQTPLSTSYRIAFGIGLHNLGEGLAIGAAFGLGEIALGVFLIVGFTLHNVTEGVGIAAPILRERPPLVHFAGLAALAGTPAIFGVWIGGFIYSPFWATLFLAIGIGALAQVIVEVSRLITRWSQRRDGGLVNWTTFGGVTAGIAIMYLTALVVLG
jgi:zinc transporter, ZIP family